MWISLTTILLFGVCPLTFPAECNEISESSSAEEEELKEVSLKSDCHGSDSPTLKAADNQNLEKESEISEETEESAEKPWLNAELNLKWKKVLHKIKHVAGKVIESAATSAAGKAIAGAILA